MSSTLVAFFSRTELRAALTSIELQRLLDVTVERDFAKGANVVSVGSSPDHWYGVIQGCVVQSVTGPDGHESFLSAVQEGSFFGEGTVMKVEPYGYDAIALRRSKLAMVPRRMFETLRATSLPFNHFLQNLLSSRLSAFIAMAINSRLSSIEARVSRALVSLAAPYPLAGCAQFIRISQTELAMLAGTSRQRTNVALGQLAEWELVKARHQGIEILKPDELRAIAGNAGHGSH